MKNNVVGLIKVPQERQVREVMMKVTEIRPLKKTTLSRCGTPVHLQNCMMQVGITDTVYTSYINFFQKQCHA